MNLKQLLAGIGVVIDDAFGKDGNPNDRIVGIVDCLERDWKLPCYSTDQLPPEDHRRKLFRSASFIVLDWKLWPDRSGPELVEHRIGENVAFLEQATRHFVPVLIFTNENIEDVARKLPEHIFRPDKREVGSVFIRNKTSLLSDNRLDLSSVAEWMSQNASVYALKRWEGVFFDARSELFGDMYAISPHWPNVFWRAYDEDGVDPSLGLTQLIADGLAGRIRTDAFTGGPLGGHEIDDNDVDKNDLRALIQATTFRATQPDDDIRCGDVFRPEKKKVLLNLRPDCDCVPRDGQMRDAVELYCIEGKVVRESELVKGFEKGHFRERDDQSIVFAMTRQWKSFRFRFKNLRLRCFGDIKDQRIGRLLHPYLTRIQQRYALYLQRQGLPRIPAGAVSAISGDGEDT